MDQFGAEVKRLREEMGLSQAELAQKTGITQSYISHIENGVREGKIDVLFALSRALGVESNHFAQFFPAEAPQTPAPPPAGKKGKK